MSDIKQQLTYYRSLKKKLEVLEERIHKIQSADEVADTVQASSHEFPYIKHTITIRGKEELSKKEKKRLQNYKQEKNKCLQALDELETFIRNIEDPQVQVIFSRRYVDGWSWQRISMIFHSVHESYARKIHDRYLKELEIKNQKLGE